jgi:hypothetical protein
MLVTCISMHEVALRRTNRQTLSENPLPRSTV